MCVCVCVFNLDCVDMETMVFAEYKSRLSVI